MGKGYKQKTRWRTLNIGAPPEEEDVEDGIRNGYTKGQKNGTNSRTEQKNGHKSGRTNSTGSATSDYPRNYASVVSRSIQSQKRDDSDSGNSTSHTEKNKPKIIFNEDEYTRINTPRQDVLFKKGYLSQKKAWASTASTSATPSTTESQSASHSTADGSETTEDQQLLDCKENGAEEYPRMVDPGPQVAYGTFYDHTSGYYYEYPMMVVDPGVGMPGTAMHNVLTAVPCGPVPFRPIEWINPAFVPKFHNEEYCVMDYQTAQLPQYPTLLDENGLPLTTLEEMSNGSEKPCLEDGTESVTCADNTVANKENGEEEQTDRTATESGTGGTRLTNVEETARAAVNCEPYLEDAQARPLQATHVAIPPVPQPYIYPGHFMFGPPLVNVDGVTIQCGPMVWNTETNDSLGNTRSWFKGKKKRKLSKRRPRRPLDTGDAEDEEHEEEEEECRPTAADWVENVWRPSKITETGIKVKSKAGNTGIDGTAECNGIILPSTRPLNPECREFRPDPDSRIANLPIVDTNTGDQSIIATDRSTAESLSSSLTESSRNNEPSTTSISVDKIERQQFAKDFEANREKSPNSELPISCSNGGNACENYKPRKNEEEGTPVEFAAEVFANVTTIAEKALISRGVVDGTRMETEIGLDATWVNFQEIVETNHDVHSSNDKHTDDSRRNQRFGSIDVEIVPNGQATVVEEACSSVNKMSITDQVSTTVTEADDTSWKRRPGMRDKHESRATSPGMINRTTTPINAMPQSLPFGNESLINRGSNASSSSSCSVPTSTATSAAQQQSSRNRKFSAKGPKFVREATPGPDLDVIQTHADIAPDDVHSIAIKNNIGPTDNTEPIVVTAQTVFRRHNQNENYDEAIVMGIEVTEAGIEKYSVSTKDDPRFGKKKDVKKRSDENAEASNDDSGVEMQTRFSMNHPITDAVTEWLQHANSPELFITSAMVLENESENDELVDEEEEEEPPKNLEGNPMPALSANSSCVNDIESSRLASSEKFARVIDGPVNSIQTTRIEKNNKKNNNSNSNDNNNNNNVKNNGNNDRDKKDKSIGDSRRTIRTEAKRRGSKKIVTKATTNIEPIISVREEKIVRSFCANTSENVNELDDGAARGSSVETTSSDSPVDNNVAVADDVCEFTEKDSVAGMRVAKSSRIKEEEEKKKEEEDEQQQQKEEDEEEEEDNKKENEEKSKNKTKKMKKKKKPSNRKSTEEKSAVIILSSRGSPIHSPVENVEVKVRRIIEENDEGIVEDEEVCVRTYEKGRIVVSIDGKVIPVSDYKPILLRNQDWKKGIERTMEIDEKPKFSRITCEKSRREDDAGDERSTISDESFGKRNSIGSIEEPDVLECWEVETVEPVKTNKAIEDRGKSEEGEANEDEFSDSKVNSADYDIVRKYYRLEAMRESGTSDKSIECYSKNNDTHCSGFFGGNSVIDSPDSTIVSIRSEVIPVIGEHLDRSFDLVLDGSNIPVDEAVEVYETFCTGKSQQRLPELDSKLQRSQGFMYGYWNSQREGYVPRKAACCNVQ